eukprot:COSAG06_NODE_3288_length_5551_cov_25.524578_2_plen_85_part_00
MYASSKVIVSNASSLCRREQTGQGRPCPNRAREEVLLLPPPAAAGLPAVAAAVAWRGVALARTALAALDVNKFAHCRKEGGGGW